MSYIRKAIKKHKAGANTNVPVHIKDDARAEPDEQPPLADPVELTESAHPSQMPVEPAGFDDESVIANPLELSDDVTQRPSRCIEPDGFDDEPAIKDTVEPAEDSTNPSYVRSEPDGFDGESAMADAAEDAEDSINWPSAGGENDEHTRFKEESAIVKTVELSEESAGTTSLRVEPDGFDGESAMADTAELAEDSVTSSPAGSEGDEHIGVEKESAIVETVELSEDSANERRDDAYADREFEQTPPLHMPHEPRIPYAFAKRHGVLVGEVGADHIDVVYREGVSSAALLEVRRLFGRALRPRKLEAEAFEQLLIRHYEGGSGQANEIMDDLGDDLDLQSVADALPEPEDLLEAEDDAPIIRLINAILTEAVRKNASDVHIEPFERRLSIRLRIDGVMLEILEPPRTLAPLLISRIKVMARLDIAEKRLPQDGRISLRVAGRAVDVRVSTLPSGHGERVVLRLLDKQAGRLDLEQLGMQANIRRRIHELIRLPHGILLVTGPTGSGKTTSLYAALTRLNDRSRSILTVEDPIEYYIDGVGQTQVNTRVDLTFARGLRAILRQDPDVVMVGEVRDLETAEIAVQASLTGHLVMSTLHTNTAVGAVTRLRDMGVEPFLLSSSLIGVVAQRLVRLLCPKCKIPHELNEAERAALGVVNGNHYEVFGPSGCEHCNGTGYYGRSGIYELLLIDETLRTLIHDNASEHDLEHHARTLTPSIRDDGRRRVLAGDTSLAEVLRVTREN
jgi:general secretion pathway protein E